MSLNLCFKIVYCIFPVSCRDWSKPQNLNKFTCNPKRVHTKMQWRRKPSFGWTASCQLNHSRECHVCVHFSNTPRDGYSLFQCHYNFSKEIFPNVKLESLLVQLKAFPPVQLLCSLAPKLTLPPLNLFKDLKWNKHKACKMCLYIKFWTFNNFTFT